MNRIWPRLAAVVAAAVCGASSLPAATGESQSCEQLAALALPSARVTQTEVVDGGDRRFGASRPFCRAAVTIAPTADSDIRSEVWLPLIGWNGKFQAVGNGDAAGAISYHEMATAVDRGYATSSTDTGHRGNSMAFALGHREQYVDFGYRAVHEMTVKAKAIVGAFYGTPARAAYWNGCSQGGRQGITEAARYPDDYDAVIAGAPAIGHMALHAERLAVNRFAHRIAGSYIPPEKYPAIHQAALAACDARDGVADGTIADPTHCRFDPAVLVCSDGDRPSCLTPTQVETARGLYDSLLLPGTELDWARLAGPEPLRNAVEPFKYVVFGDPQWDWRAFRFDTDLPRALAADTGVINFTDPDLRPFFDRGGKLLMYHGWADPQIPPAHSVKYFDDVLKIAGEGARGRSIALYMEPGVAHCWGGVGPDTIDAVGAIEQWELSGAAPSALVASRWTDDAIDRTRPLCLYPESAVYRGVGSTDAAGSFRCAAPDLRTGTAPRASRAAAAGCSSASLPHSDPTRRTGPPAC